MYGKDVRLFRKNKAAIAFEKAEYDFVKLSETVEYSDFGEQIVIVIRNPYQLKIRPEKQIAGVLGLSRNQVKDLSEQGKLQWKTELPQSISVRSNSGRFHMDQ